VFSFEEADESRKDLFGGKGAQLAGMTSLGLPVPSGFTITTKACLEYFRAGKAPPEGMWGQTRDAMRELETATGLRFGDPSNPLLVSVRSGAVVSMPGMMDTILNLGINEQVAEVMAERTADPRFALDLYRRFIQMFANVVMGVEGGRFDQLVNGQQLKAGVTRSSELTAADLRQVVAGFKHIVKEETGGEVPEDPEAQLERAIQAVFDSWDTRRAIDYRNFHGISHDLGTAVNVVSMIYGNRDDNSCTGVLFTRDPSTGEKKLYGEYLVNAQGEDVVAGTTTPREFAHMATEMPDIHRQLVEVSDRLESHYRDAQDVEFTVEQGKLYMLQTRSAKRSAKAAVKMAVDQVSEGMITKEEALMRIEPNQIYQLLLPRLDEKAIDQAKADGRLLGVGLGASPGGATGRLVLTADAAAEQGRQGATVILARPETSPEDVHGMLAAAGVLTSRGGTTSHAAVVARGLGKPCVAGAESIEVSPEGGYVRRGAMTVREGEEISIDGSTGAVFVGAIATIEARVSEEKEMVTVLSWADDVRRLGVWANADYPRDAQLAVEFGAEGIGLCRTEHMFFETDRLPLVHQMILAAHASTKDPDDAESRDRYHSTLARLQEYQIGDFEGIFRAMGDRPVTIRLLDPPLHEFLPKYETLLAEVVEQRAKGTDPGSLKEKESLLSAIDEMREANPMLGLRGCRLGLLYPDIYAMQARAILTAASNVAAEGVRTRPEIMVPLVAHKNEMSRVRQHLEETVRQLKDEGVNIVDYEIGTMIETPRAALTADEIAESAEFFSFGTNDLTQTVYGMSRDDAEGKFLMQYVEDRILPEDPFQSVDRKGVGQLVEMGTRLGRQARPGLVVGICGEHGGDPSSIEFFHAVGLDYVSCSPYRIPVARLVAAQAAIRSANTSDDKRS
jgi:pyruvate,orthophosphate dikinase